jgi:uncharacterized protein YheU (UPF0270 family)
MDIPIESLSAEALHGVIDEFILREGTDYGAIEATLERKRREILSQLQSGEAKLVYDSETETVTLVPAK